MSIKNISFEVQVRTIAMDAWDTISHYLNYKREEAIPENLRRDFFALSGLFYVADTHFEMFFKASEESQHRMEELMSQDDRASVQAIDLDSLKAYLHRRLPDREGTDSKALSVLVAELQSAGIQTIGELDRLFDRAWSAFLALEAADPPHGRRGRRFNEVGVTRTVCELAVDRFSQIRGFEPPPAKFRMMVKE